MVVKKKKGVIEDFNFEKIVNAISKSADRIGHKFTKK